MWTDAKVASTTTTFVLMFSSCVFQILIDNVDKPTGSLYSDSDLQPPKEIKYPEAKKAIFLKQISHYQRSSKGYVNLVNMAYAFWPTHRYTIEGRHRECREDESE
ncbi:hypothetical protein Vadar_000325 [Vaccinium darrowii]|uniref:Uncharacterized protein n=1 Tax=Vaccinium darrowii TaxID=229202 RepID=A0ACB7XNE5_9ERIC|nr:hypothetical protein Vadar_000325 [Vaccinium darrowii]